MYKVNEKLELLSDYKKEGETGFIKKGTTVYFQAAHDDKSLKSVVQVKHKDQILIVPELAVKPLETDPSKILKEWNAKIIAERKDLGIYHHNFFVRMYYKFIGLFKKAPVKKKDLSRLKNLMKED